VQGNINGELSPGTYAELIAAALRRDMGTVTAITGLSITITGTGPTYTVTRSAGDFLTSGIKRGDVVRLTAGAFVAGNLNKNLLVVGITALALTVRVLNGSSLTAEGPIATSTVTLPGKKTYIPSSSHTNKSFTVEHWFSDLVQSERFDGCFISSLEMQLPASGLSTIGLGVMGMSMTAATSQYFTTPTAASTSGLLAAVNGIALVNGTPIASLTSMQINVASARMGDAVVGSNSIPTLFPGRVLVSGQATAYFDSVTLRDAFLNETELELIATLSASNDAAAAFISIALPRVKVNGHTLSDGEDGLSATVPFQALLPTTGGSGVANELSTMVYHDSAA
jgi:hypothetical protein